MTYTELIAKIAADIVPGLPKGITAEKLKSLFEDIAQFANETRGDYQGTAAPADNPGTPTDPVYYTATVAGTYTDFGGVVITSEDIEGGWVQITFAPGTGWDKNVVSIELAPYAQKSEFPKTFESEDNIHRSKNLLDSSAVTAGSYNTSGVNSGSVNWISGRAKINPGVEYTISGIGTASAATTRFIFLNESESPISNISSNGTETQTFISPAGAKYVLINLANVTNIGLSPTSNIYTDTMQLEEGATASAYEPYYFGYDSNQLVNFDSRVAASPIVASVVQFTTETQYLGKNIFNKANAVQGNIGPTGVYSSVSTNWVCSDFMEIKPSQDYAIQGFFSGASAILAVAWYDENQVFISGSALNGTANRTFTSPANAKYLRCTIANAVGVGSSPTDNPYVNSFMVEEGLSHSAYEPFFTTKKIDPAAIFNLTNYVAEELGISATLSNVYFSLDINGFSGNELLMIYVKIGLDYFVGFQFVHQIDATSTVYMNQWRVFQADLFRLVSGAMISQSKRILEVGDSEGVYRLSGSEDFTGGVHGDEQVTAIKFFADGVELASIASDIPLTGCNTFKVLSKSTTHESPATGNVPNLSHPVETNRIKELVFGDGGYSIFNRWTWITTPARAVIILYHGICCTHKNAAQEGYTDADFSTLVFNGDNTNKLESTGFRDFKANNDTNGLSVMVTSKLLKPDVQDETCDLFIWDRAGDSKYYRMYENPVAVNGTVWESSMTVKWSKL